MKKSCSLLPGLLTPAVAAILLSCASMVAQQLPLQGLQAKSTFPRLVACAQARNLLTVEHPKSVHARYDPNTWIQFAIQGEQYNMVVVLDSEVAEDERARRTAAAKAMGDELFTCSVQNGALFLPSAATDDSGLSQGSGIACVGAVAPACRSDSECQSQNCTAGVCQERVPGSLCGSSDAHCDSLNCTDGCCQPRTPGSPCGSSDHHCNSLNCTNGHCQLRTLGAPCRSDAHCDSLNCTRGRCEPRGPGSPCGSTDAHCDSLNCLNGSCS